MVGAVFLWGSTAGIVLALIGMFYGLVKAIFAIWEFVDLKLTEKKIVEKLENEVKESGE